MKKFLILFLFTSVLLCAQSFPSPEDSSAAPDTFKVSFVTTKGEFIVEAYRNWSPLGVDRFFHLVKKGYYNGLPIFRVVKNFVAQFGISNDHETNLAWDNYPIKDEPVIGSNLKGVLSFARSGVNTRSTQLFINLKDNTRLDSVAYNGVTGFPPIGRIIEGLEVIDNLNSEYGESPSQDSITVKGREYTERVFPQMDYINKAEIISTKK
jgi:peptidyl-prolyl cis-trans isomerase A (cyclophilin A)